MENYIQEGENFDYIYKEEKFLFMTFKTKETYREHILRLVKKYLTQNGVI